MTKKDYILIAEALRRARTYGTDAASEIADALKSDNARFDRNRFLAAATRE